MDKLYEMGLHDEWEINRTNVVMRVAGGWIYKTYTCNNADEWRASITFVPYDNEFQRGTKDNV